MHDGRCWVEERAEGGASFRVYLPDAASKMVDEPPAEDGPRAATTPDRPFDERSMALARALAEADDELAV